LATNPPNVVPLTLLERPEPSALEAAVGDEYGTATERKNAIELTQELAALLCVRPDMLTNPAPNREGPAVECERRSECHNFVANLHRVDQHDRLTTTR
jgi:hypothetical protein